MADRTAILIDAENVLVAKPQGDEVGFQELISGLIARYEPIVRIEVFIDQRAPKWMLDRVRAVKQSTGFVVIQTNPHGDMALVVRGMQLIQESDALVLVSGDSDFVPLLQAASESGVRTTIVSPILSTSSELAVVAMERLTPGQLVPRLGGLIAPGEGADKLELIARHFKQAVRRVVVMDPWTSEATVRLMAFGACGVELILVARRVSEATHQEASDVIAQGASFALYQTDELHDRWFAVDEKWYHSGGSLKDLGRRWTRVSSVTDAKEIADTEGMLRRLMNPGNRIL